LPTTDRRWLRRAPKKKFTRVYDPIGLDPGRSSPKEIAVVILAEVIAVRRGAKIGNCS